MAIIKGRLRPEGTNNYADVVHLETSGEQVKLNNGQTVEQLSTQMAELDTKVETHKADIATQDTIGHIKLSDIPIYTHPTDAGNKHIPSGGGSGQFLAWGGSSGTAMWEDIRVERYLYDKGFQYAEFVEGYRDPTGSITAPEVKFSPSTIGLSLPAAYEHEGDAAGEIAVVTSRPIDLTGWNLLRVNWRGHAYNKGYMDIVISTDKAGKYSVYDKRVSVTLDNPGSSDTPYIDTNVYTDSLSGEYYIRIHTRITSYYAPGAYHANVDISEIQLLK